MKKKASKRALALLTSGIAICLAAIIAASVLLPRYQIAVDAHFLGDGIDVSNYDPTSAALTAQEVQSEGIVLVKNKGGLPLAPQPVTLWGIGSAHTAYTGYGSGGGDATDAIRLRAALEGEGFTVYEDLYAFYDSRGTTGNTGTFSSVGADTTSNEIDPDAISQAVKEGARQFSDVAIYVLSRVGAENGVMTQKDLALSEYEEKTLDYVTENFDHVIVLLNTANQFEFGFLDGTGVSRNSGESFSKYVGKIDGALWVGAPGEVGTYAIAKALTGEINPSGHFADTYAYSLESSPAAQNYFKRTFTDLTNVPFCNYIENIYVGYKWYETAAYEGAIDYSDAIGTPSLYTDGTIPMGVQYPFGYGLSYTTFDWELVDRGATATSKAFTAEDARGSITVRVKVTNTGSTAGKDVVQCYFTPPYENGGIEKAYVNLVGFAKTPLIQPGKSATVDITFSLYDMASYDDKDRNGNGFAGYELEAGEYQIRLLENAHGWADPASADMTRTYTVAEDILYPISLATGAEVTNQFPDLDGGIEFLSRADHFTNAEVVRIIDRASTDYTDHTGDTTFVRRTNMLSDGAPEGEVNKYEKYVDYEVDLGEEIIRLPDMVDVPYEDAKWDTFVSQLSKSEMAELIAYGGYSTIGIERLGIPATVMLDGPSAVKSTYASGAGTLLQPSEVVLASTWNQELAYRQGVTFGSDAASTNVTGWYAPSVNIHRAPYNGRNYEYYSEDAALSGLMAVQVTSGAQACGINVTLKHLLLYCDASTPGWKWCTEQAVREIYLRPFQMGIERADARQLMTSNSFNGIWIGCSGELLNNVIRGEFGFKGLIVSDAATPLFWVKKGIRAGNDLWLSFENSRRVTLVKEKNVGAMQTACKNILYAVSRSPVAMGTKIEKPDWSPALVGMIVLDAFFGVLLILLSVLTIREIRRLPNGIRQRGALSTVLAAVLGFALVILIGSTVFYAIANVSRNLFAEWNRTISTASFAGMIVSLILGTASFIALGRHQPKKDHE